MPLLLEWRESKAASNYGKHGIRFIEAATVFGDPLSLTVLDADHSEDEDQKQGGQRPQIPLPDLLPLTTTR